jgi:glucose-6-phosphate dehydrogenase assembly protein OpcA
MIDLSKYATPKARARFEEIYRDLADDAITDTVGDVVDNGYIAYRIGTDVIVSTADGHGAIDHGTVKAAQADIRALKP